MSSCQICKGINSVKVLLDCGQLPLCNRFVLDPNAREYKQSLIVGQCLKCGLIQLTKPVPPEEISPRFDWLKYNEPEDHLDSLANTITSLPGISEKSVACGITLKDDSLLSRLENRKFNRTWRIDPATDLDIAVRGAGAETVLNYLLPEAAKKLVSKYGQADVVIARHVYEHAPHTHKLLEAINYIVKPNGYVVFEIPDCTKMLEYKDYSMLWEEHMLYFTPETFCNSFEFTAFSLVHYECFSYPTENALVSITQLNRNNKPVFIKSEVLAKELDSGKSYVEGFGTCREELIKYLNTLKKAKRKVVVFGAGHLACMFINLMGIRDKIEYVVDDDPNKKGLYMPGSRLPIYGSQKLVEDKINLCLLSLSPESERKVIEKNQAYIKQGGKFASIFRTSNSYIGR